MITKPSPRLCSMCEETLQPVLMATSVDSNYNTVEHWSFGHNCPAQSKKYNERLKEIEVSNMNQQQKHNAATAAGYMNAWGS